MSACYLSGQLSYILGCQEYDMLHDDCMVVSGELMETLGYQEHVCWLPVQGPGHQPVENITWLQTTAGAIVCTLCC